MQQFTQNQLKKSSQLQLITLIGNLHNIWNNKLGQCDIQHFIVIVGDGFYDFLQIARYKKKNKTPIKFINNKNVK